MGDSDDEREFGKRRDKFHTERRGQDRGDDERRGGFGGLWLDQLSPPFDQYYYDSVLTDETI